MRWNARSAEDLFLQRVPKAFSSSTTPGCENSTAKALLFWLVKSATIPLFCPEKFRSRALTQFNNSQHSRIVATNENEMWARIRAKQVVKDFFSVVGFWFYARHFSSRRVVLFSLMTMRQRLWTVIRTKCIEEERGTKARNSFFQTLKYFFSTPAGRDATASAKEGIKRERNDETFLRFVLRGLRRIYIHNQQTHSQSRYFFGSLRRLRRSFLRKYYILTLRINNVNSIRGSRIRRGKSSASFAGVF